MKLNAYKYEQRNHKIKPNLIDVFTNLTNMKLYEEVEVCLKYWCVQVNFYCAPRT